MSTDRTKNVLIVENFFPVRVAPKSLSYRTVESIKKDYWNSKEIRQMKNSFIGTLIAMSLVVSSQLGASKVKLSIRSDHKPFQNNFSFSVGPPMPDHNSPNPLVVRFGQLDVMSGESYQTFNRPPIADPNSPNPPAAQLTSVRPPIPEPNNPNPPAF
jgi:hypothetical protein